MSKYYTNQNMKDPQFETPNNFRIEDNGDGTYRLIPAFGEQKVEDATPMSGDNIQTLEKGVENIGNAVETLETADTYVKKSGDRMSGKLKLSQGLEVINTLIAEDDLTVKGHIVSNKDSTFDRKLIVKDHVYVSNSGGEIPYMAKTSSDTFFRVNHNDNVAKYAVTVANGALYNVFYDTSGTINRGVKTTVDALYRYKTSGKAVKLQDAGLTLNMFEELLDYMKPENEDVKYNALVNKLKFAKQELAVLESKNNE